MNDLIPPPPPPVQMPTAMPAPTPDANPAPTPETPKVLMPDEVKAKRKLMLKRLAIVAGSIYGISLVWTFLWAIISYGKDFSLFDYLPISQIGFSAYWMTVFHVQMGLAVSAALIFALVYLLKSLLAKKEEIEKKKRGSKRALIGGLSFLLLAVLWLVGIWFLGPRLMIYQLYKSPIVTTPSVTLGLTSPITISFDASLAPIDTGTYSVLAYTWDFGDGSMANGQVVEHQYTHKATGNGIYTVTLNIEYMDLKSGEQFDYETTTQVVIENEQTAASFVANPDSGEIPLNVTFDATSSFDPDGEIVSYEWDFDGDGRFDDAEGEIVKNTFTQEGTFEITLRVTDNNNQSSTTSMTIEAGSVGGLRAVITPPLSEGETYYTKDDYQFSGSLSQIKTGKIVKYAWDFGDGTKLQSRSVSHAYTKAGTYTVKLTVQDANGNSDESTLEIQVVEEGTPPTAVIKTTPTLSSGKVSGPVPLTVVFDGSTSSDAEKDIVDYSWDFDNDGEIDNTGDKVSYTYEEEGNFEARLITTDSAGNSGETTVKVEVTAQGITARLEIDSSNGEVPLTVKFNASASSYKEGSIVSYTYDFGDGSTAYVGGSNVTYKYTSVGTYTATLTVTGSDGKKDTESVQIVVRPVSLTACFTVNTDTGSAPLFVAVDPSCSQGTITSYSWSFGDGDISFDRKPSVHTYSTAGTYTITLEVTGDTGIVDTITKTLTVK